MCLTDYFFVETMLLSNKSFSVKVSFFKWCHICEQPAVEVKVVCPTGLTGRLLFTCGAALKCGERERCAADCLPNGEISSGGGS